MKRIYMGFLFATCLLISSICQGGRPAVTAAPRLRSGDAKVNRDWSKYPAIVQLDTQQDIFVIGDPHADLDRLTAVLTGAHIIKANPADPSQPSWSARNAVAVFTGDMIDKGTNSLGVIALLRSLQTAAANAGGRVIITMGNHEAEFLASPDEKKVQEFAGELTKAGLSPQAVAACDGDLGQFLCSLPFAARVNDWFFSHAGNTAGRTMAKLTADLQAGVDKDGFASKELIGDDSLLEARLGDKPWFEPHAQTTLTTYVSALGVDHIVEGHQPGKVTFGDGTKRKSGEMFQRYGLIFLEDTGMSSEINDSHGAALHIFAGKNGPQADAICPDGSVTTVWDNSSHKDLGKAKPCGGS